MIDPTKSYSCEIDSLTTAESWYTPHGDFQGPLPVRCRALFAILLIGAPTHQLQPASMPLATGGSNILSHMKRSMDSDIVRLNLPGQANVQGLHVDRLDVRVGGLAHVRVRVQVGGSAGVGNLVPYPVDVLVRGLVPA